MANDAAYSVHRAEFVSWAKEYDGPKFHAVLSDPPYGLKFMGKDWDVVSAKEWGEALLRVLHPGAIVFMFSGTRTWHKLASGMEEAGFQMWDTLMWLYGQGFPKAQDISKLIDGANGDERRIIGVNPLASKQTAAISTASYGDYSGSPPMLTAPASEQSAPWSGHKTCALKPAWEPILAFRAPSQGKTYAELATEFGSGCLNVDGARIPVGDGDDPRLGGKGTWGTGAMAQSAYGDYAGGRVGSSPQGRYPANLILDEESAEMLDGQTGTREGCKPHWVEGTKDYEGWGSITKAGRMAGFNDFGGASRFFYCAKASSSERNAGLAGRNQHPTIKPIALTKWLATLLLPPASVSPRRLLVPFCGTGSEIIGALQAGWDEVVGVERDEQSAQVAELRLAHWVKDTMNG